MSVVAENLFQSGLEKEFKLELLDISDRRGLSNIGRLELKNLLLALKHGFAFARSLVKRRPELIYLSIAQNRLGYLRDCLFLIPCRVLRIPYVVHVHGGAFGKFYSSTSRPFKWLVRWTLERASRVVVLGACLKHMFHGILDERQIVVVPNGVPPIGLTVPEKPSRLDRPRKQILYLSNLLSSKGFLDLLRASVVICREYPEAQFVFAGEVHSVRELEIAEEFIIENQLFERVHIVGVIAGRKKAQTLLESDIFVLPTYYPLEGQPLSILEAMAAGLPIISTNQGAIAETVIDKLNGFIIPAKDTQALVEKLRLLLTDGRQRQAMGLSSRERYLSHYTLERWSADMASVFRSVLAQYD